MFLKGWLYCLLWYSSIMAGYAGLFCPLLPVLFISNKLYRNITDVLFTFWQYYPTALMEFLCGCSIQVTGDPILTNETSLLVMNHRTRTDWNFLWPTVYHCVMGKWRVAHSTKFVLKDIIRHIPGPGWVMQLACFVFIKRSWMLDKEIFKDYVDYVADLNYKHSLIVFPEGTDLTEQTRKISDRYAEENQLQKYRWVLHPRTTGFTYLASQMLSKSVLDAIYDVTIIYPDLVPQNEKALLNGHFPKVVRLHFVRYPSEFLPRSELGLREFLERRWLDKERNLDKWYHAHGLVSFHGRYLRNPHRWELYFAFAFWTLLPAFVLVVLISSFWFQLVVAVHTVFFLGVHFGCEGFQNFEIALHKFKKNRRGATSWGYWC